MHKLSCENEFYLHENENHFHIKGWVLNLVLIQRLGGGFGNALLSAVNWPPPPPMHLPSPPPTLPFIPFSYVLCNKLSLFRCFILSFVNLFFSQIIMDLIPYVCFELLRKRRRRRRRKSTRYIAERGNPSVTNSSSEYNIISSNHEYVNASN